MPKLTYIDPPSGWRYGFPKVFPDGVQDVKCWLIDNGYPEAEILASGKYFNCRFWQEPDPAPDLTAEVKALRTALNWFVNDPRFQVAVGGNPRVVQQMIVDAKSLAKEGE